MKTCLFLLGILLMISYTSAVPLRPLKQDKCADVPPMCYQLVSPNYKKMRLPNMLNHTRDTDVIADLQLWEPLLNSSQCNAADQLKYFLCFTYAPVCVDKLISPCKSLCETVRDSCDPVMRPYNRSWPAFFNCDQPNKFQDDSSQMCINLKMLGIKKDDCSCKGSYGKKALRSLICKSDFVFSAWVTKHVRRSNQIDVKTSRIFFRKPFLQNLKTRLANLQLTTTKKHCHCNRLRVKKKARGSGRYLIIGSKVAGKMQVNALKRMTDRQEIVKMVKAC